MLDLVACSLLIVKEGPEAAYFFFFFP